MSNKLSLLTSILLIGMISNSYAVTLIYFEDGVINGEVGASYSGLGVTFINTQWRSLDDLPGGSGVLGISSLSGDTHFGIDDSIVANFSSTMSSASIAGIDIGNAGLRIEAYDSENNLSDFSETFGVGAGVGNFATLSVNGSFSRIVIFQPLGFAGSSDDGVILDNLSFTMVPVPAGIWLLLSGLLVIYKTCKRYPYSAKKLKQARIK